MIQQILWSSTQEFIDAIKFYDNIMDQKFILEEDDDDHHETVEPKLGNLQADIEAALQTMHLLSTQLREPKDEEKAVSDDNFHHWFYMRTKWPINVCTRSTINTQALFDKIERLHVATVQERNEFDAYMHNRFGSLERALTAAGIIAANAGICQWD